MRPTDLHVADVQRKFIDDETAILEHWLGTRESYLWVVTPRSLRALKNSLDPKKVLNPGKLLPND